MKKYFKVLVLSLLIIIPINIYAYDLSCDTSEHKVGDVFSCKISGNNAPYDKMSGTIESDPSLSCKVASSSPGLQALETANDTYFDFSGTSSSNDLVVLSCKVLTNPSETENARVYVNDFTYHITGSGTNEATEILKSDYIKINHVDDSGPVDNKPRDISDPSVRPRRLTSKELNITFSQFITEYTVEVLFDTEEITFDYELNDQTSSLRIEGSTKLQVGNNTIDIYITNADGSKEACYTFYVERLARGEEIYYPESDSTLESMVIPGYSIGFNKDVLEYKIHLTNDVDSVNINTIPSYEKATISITNADNLKNGDVIAVEVTSADETSKTTYKIKVTKDAPKKDYSMIIIITLLSLAFVGTIVMFIVTNNKKKSDPLLSIKTNKRKINKGKNFDVSTVPDSTNENNITNNSDQNFQIEQEQINTLNLNSDNTVAPTQTDKVVVESFNQATNVAETVNLNTTVEPTVVTENNVNSSNEQFKTTQYVQEPQINENLNNQNVPTQIPEQPINNIQNNMPAQNQISQENHPQNNQNFNQ